MYLFILYNMDVIRIYGQNMATEYWGELDWIGYCRFIYSRCGTCRGKLWKNGLRSSWILITHYWTVYHQNYSSTNSVQQGFWTLFTWICSNSKNRCAIIRLHRIYAEPWRERNISPTWKRLPGHGLPPNPKDSHLCFRKKNCWDLRGLPTLTISTVPRFVLHGYLLCCLATSRYSAGKARFGTKIAQEGLSFGINEPDHGECRFQTLICDWQSLSESVGFSTG